MRAAFWRFQGVSLLIGLLVGALLTAFWPQTPLHAVATDRVDTFAIATGPVEDEVEAIYFLDFLTGDLKAAVMGRNEKFQALFVGNVMQDFGITPANNPKFLMVTGINTFRGGGGNVQPASAVLYVAEITTGQCVVYGLPWPKGARAAGRPINSQLTPLDKFRFRNAAGAAGVAPPTN